MQEVNVYVVHPDEKSVMVAEQLTVAEAKAVQEALIRYFCERDGYEPHHGSSTYTTLIREADNSDGWEMLTVSGHYY